MTTMPTVTLAVILYHRDPSHITGSWAYCLDGVCPASGAFRTLRQAKLAVRAQAEAAAEAGGPLVLGWVQLSERIWQLQGVEQYPTHQPEDDILINAEESQT